MAGSEANVSKASDPQRIGLLGGSFDPVHLAHVALAAAAHTALGLDQVQFIPAANPWQRKPLAASPEHRLAMLELATRQLPYVHINPLEIERGGRTYTLDTLRQLPAGPRYIWILGADQLANFCSWHGWQDILDVVELAVADRPGSSLSPPEALVARLAERGHTLHTLPFNPMPVSATDIRRRLAAGEPTNGQLDVAVERYIQDNHLYRNPQGVKP